MFFYDKIINAYCFLSDFTKTTYNIWFYKHLCHVNSWSNCVRQLWKMVLFRKRVLQRYDTVNDR